MRGLRHLLGVGFVYVAPGRQASGMIHGGSRSNDDVIQVGKPGGDGVVIFVFAGVGGGRRSTPCDFSFISAAAASSDERSSD